MGEGLHEDDRDDRTRGDVGASPPPPGGLADLTPEWLTRAIGSAFGGRVVGLGATPIGTGQVADSARLALQWDPPGAGPDSLVAKVTSSSDTSRSTARMTRTYEVEVGFYTDLASGLEVNAPRCHWAGYDEVLGTYAVVLDDLAPCVQGDQRAGCTTDEAATALAELPLLHAPRWGDRALESIAWLNRSGPTRGAELGAFLTMLLPNWLERYADRLSDDVVALVERFVPRLAGYVDATSGDPKTIVHGDYRNDNLMFGAPRVWVLDGQTVALGAALSDVSYVLGGSLLVDDRREHEQDLVRSYCDALAAQGVPITFDVCWDDYRRFAFAGLIMAIGASMVVERTDRGDEMFIAMAERAARHALDLESEIFVP